MTSINQLVLPVLEPFEDRHTLHSAIYQELGFRMAGDNEARFVYSPIGDRCVIIRGKLADEDLASKAEQLTIPAKGETVRLVGDLILRFTKRNPSTFKKIRSSIAMAPDAEARLTRWFERHQGEYGFEMIENNSITTTERICHDDKAQHLGKHRLRGVCKINITAQVTDPDLLATAMTTGIGAMRGYGYGLLHILPV